MTQKRVSLSWALSIWVAMALLAGLASLAQNGLAAPPPPQPPAATPGFTPSSGVSARELKPESTLVVTNINDSGAGSLRAQIAAAASGDSIIFNSSLSGQVITLTSAQLDVSKNLTIDGSALASQLSISGNNARRVFNITNNATVTLKGLGVIRGSASEGAGIYVNSGSTLNLANCLVSGNISSSFGGGVINYGTLRVNSCAVTGNQGTWGGGLENRSTLTITDTTFITNTATQGGGGAETWGGTVTIIRSAFINNTAYNGSTLGSGGGFQSDPGTGNVNLTNVTFSGNRALGTADDGGGAIMSYGGTLYLTNLTMLANNAATHGGGISTSPSYPSTINFGSSIITGNTSGSSTPSDLYGPFISQDYNLIGTLAGATVTGSTGHNLIGQPPQLNALADNGGSTRTFAVLPGSQVTDYIPVGTNGCGAALREDQRRRGRPVDYLDYTGTGCDIGAFELQTNETYSATMNDGASLTYGATLTQIADRPGGAAPGLTTVTRNIKPLASLDPGNMPFYVDISAAVTSGLDFDLTLCATDWEVSLNGSNRNLLELYYYDGTKWQRIGFDSRTYDPATTISCVTKNHVSSLGWWMLHDPSYPTAITISSFTAVATAGHVRLNWQTLMEINTLGFNIYRSTSPAGEQIKLNAQLIPSQLPGQLRGASYEFIDTSAQFAVPYYYWLELVEAHGSNFYGPLEATLLLQIYMPMIQR